MSNDNYPQPPSHKTFNFGTAIIDSNFDSGNCSHAEKLSSHHFNLWIGVDHPKNKYRTWFHFSVSGFSPGNTLTFTIKNMQNQSRLLNEGLVPVYRQDSSSDWKRIREKVNTSSMEYCDGCLEWSFKHTTTSNEKVFLAFFYPWSNEDNTKFLKSLQEKVKENSDIYFYRNPITKSVEGRPVEFVVITSKKGKLSYQEKIQDESLFSSSKKPLSFTSDKKGIVISARVHPGEVPGSHVMTGILKQLTQKQGYGKLLRDQFVFYVFPILNPDGVGRGHYRVDTNGINLNRCYLNPSPKQQSSIYAVKKIIMHLQKEGKFFAFLDLHAHAAKKGTFIYGNCTNELLKQVQTCLFPKILSMNSRDFEYEGSNFTQKNMYCKDKGDHISKEGSGRVAMFKTTKNPYCWTLECNYNISKTNNILQDKREESQKFSKPNVNELDEQIITEYRQQPKKQAKQFFTMETYHKLGQEICQSFLDLIEKNPFSRIDNEKNHFKSVQNLKMNLAVALLRMAPNRFEPNYKKIYYSLTTSQNPEAINYALKALYLLTVKKAKIPNIKNFLKDGNMKDIDIPILKKPQTTAATNKKSRYTSLIDRKTMMMLDKVESSREIQNKINEECPKIQTMAKQKDKEEDQLSMSVQSEEEDQKEKIFFTVKQMKQRQSKYDDKRKQPKVTVKLQEFRMIGITNQKKSASKEFKEGMKTSNPISRLNMISELRTNKYRVHQLPSLGSLKQKHLVKGVKMDPHILRKGNSSKEPIIHYL